MSEPPAAAVSLPPPAVVTDFAANARPAPCCSNCATTLVGRYCHSCGQDSLPTETALRSWQDQASRVYRTVFALLCRPGLLTREHLCGRRVRYIAPFTLYINTVALFFLLSVLTDFRLSTQIGPHSAEWVRNLIASRSMAQGIPPGLFLDHADRRFQSVYTVCVSVLDVLGYAAVARLWFRRRWHDWRGPLAFSLHYMAFVFVVYMPLASSVNRVGGIGAHALIFANIGFAAVTLWLGIYLVLAVRRLFGDSWPWAVLKGITFMLMGLPINLLMWNLAVAVTLALA